MALAQRPLGRTRHHSSVLALGGFGLSFLSQSEADGVADDALARGVNHFDVAPSYGDAELKLAPSVARHRRRMFLACKTRERRADAAHEELQRSLERLCTDHFDLYQCHAVSDAFDLERLLGPGGAIAAIAAARAAGLTRFVGITGHHCAVLRQALERYRGLEIRLIRVIRCWHTGVGLRASASAVSPCLGVRTLHVSSRLGSTRQGIHRRGRRGNAEDGAVGLSHSREGSGPSIR